MSLYYQKINSQLGNIYIVADAKNLRALALDGNWENIKKRVGSMIEKNNSILEQTKEQLDEYFKGKRESFDLPLHFEGTPFEVSAWKALLKIPYGETRSYSQQAKLINNPKAVRAIGRANGLNFISIIVPCHRVIGKSGKLTGFASGLEDKEFLLKLEGIIF